MSAAARYKRKIKGAHSARIVTFDIETAPMLGYFWQPKTRYITADKVVDYGGLLSFSSKVYGVKETQFFSRWGDGEETMLAALWNMLDTADIVVGYNSDRFDIKKARTYLTGAGFPPFSPVRSVDLIKTVRSQFELPYYSLNEVAKWLGLGSKLTHQGFQLWTGCLTGNAKDQRKMELYNRRDVTLTEEVYDRLRPYIKSHPNLALWADSETTTAAPKCPNCANDKFKPAGTTSTALTLYSLYECKHCGHHVRSNYLKTRLSYREVR